MRNVLPLLVLLLAACSSPATTPTPEPNPTPTPNEGVPPEITSFTATPSTFSAGEAVKLEWSYTGDRATSVELENVDGPVDYENPTDTSGTIYPSASGYLILTVTNAYGRDQEYVDLTLAP